MTWTFNNWECLRISYRFCRWLVYERKIFTDIFFKTNKPHLLFAAYMTVWHPPPNHCSPILTPMDYDLNKLQSTLLEYFSTLVKTFLDNWFLRWRLIKDISKTVDHLSPRDHGLNKLQISLPKDVFKQVTFSLDDKLLRRILRSFLNIFLSKYLTPLIVVPHYRQESWV